MKTCSFNVSVQNEILDIGFIFRVEYTVLRNHQSINQSALFTNCGIFNMSAPVSTFQNVGLNVGD